MNTFGKLSFLLSFCITIAGCGFFGPPASGKASKLKCLYISMDSLTVHYTCGKQMISSITILDKGKTKADTFSFKIKFDPAVKEYRLPIEKETIQNKSFEILIGITESHWREGYSITISPEDFIMNKKVWAYYSPI